MQTINIIPVEHKGEKRLLVKFPFDKNLAELIKRIHDARYSATHKSWHVADNSKNYDNIADIFSKCRISGLPTDAVNSLTEMPVQELQPLKVKQKNDIPLRTADPGITIELRRFAAWMRQKRYSENTIESYCEVLLLFFKYYKGFSIHEITNDHLVQFNVDYIITQRLSYSYQNQFVNAIKLFYEKTQMRSLDISMIERPRRSRRLPKVIPKEDVQRMLKSITNLKHRMALTIIYACGLRRSELINLKALHIDLKRKQLTIFNGKGKKDRVLPLSDVLCEMLQSYVTAHKPRTYLIEGQPKGTAYSEASLESIFHKYMDDILPGHKFTLHCLRHSFATHLLESGVSLRYIQTLLGHKSSKTTEIYTWVSMSSLHNIRNPIDDFGL